MHKSLSQNTKQYLKKKKHLFLSSFSFRQCELHDLSFDKSNLTVRSTAFAFKDINVKLTIIIKAISMVQHGQIEAPGERCISSSPLTCVNLHW